MAPDSSGPGSYDAAKALGRFELVSELSKGFLGPLWIATVAGESEVALVRRLEFGGAVAKEAAEAVAAAGVMAAELKHDRIVAVIGVERDPQEVAVVSSYHEGEPLRTVFRLAGIGRKPVPPAIALRIARDVLEACVYLHERDRLAALTPDNVILGSDGITRILEPGVSAAAVLEKVWGEQPKRACYAAPEQVSGDAGDARSDLFSLGVLLWEMLRNRPLFGGSTFAQVAERVRSAAISRADSLKPAGGETIPKTLADLLERALARAPGERFRSASEMLEAAVAETSASHEQVAGYARELLAEVLDAQRRKLTLARRARPSQPESDSPAAPPPPPSTRARMVKRTLMGMQTAANLQVDPAKPVAPPKPPAPLARQKPPKPTGDAAMAIALDNDELADHTTAEPEAPSTEPPVAGEPADRAGAEPAAPSTESVVAAEALSGPMAAQAKTDASAARREDDAAGDPRGAAANLADLMAPAGGRAPDQGGAGGDDGIDRALGSAAATPSKPRANEFDMLSIADDPSDEDDLPVSAKEALERARLSASAPREAKSSAGKWIAAASVAAVVIGVGAWAAFRPSSGAAAATTAAATASAAATSHATSETTPAVATASAESSPNGPAPSAIDATSAEVAASAVAAPATTAAPAATSQAASPAQSFPPTKTTTSQPKWPPPQRPKFVPGGI